jgi:leucyl-tRNA synthetase
VLSDSPAERDLQWTEAGIEGAWRFVQRVWRLVNEVKDDAGGEDEALTRAAHIAIDGITADIEALRFNKAVAKSYELAAAIEKAPASSARRHAVKMLVQLISPAMPHLAEEAWEVLGEAGLAVDAAWPEADPAMLAQDTVTIAIQVNGKLRDEVEAAKGATREDMEALVLTREKVQRALDGKTPRKVIVVPDRLVNIVA